MGVGGGGVLFVCFRFVFSSSVWLVGGLFLSVLYNSQRF